MRAGLVPKCRGRYVLGDVRPFPLRRHPRPAVLAVAILLLIPAASASADPLPGDQPSASFTATQQASPACATDFDASASLPSATGTTITTYDWDFNNDATIDRTTSVPTVSTTLPVGLNQVALTVTDDSPTPLQSGPTVNPVTTANRAPTGTITPTPASPLTLDLVSLSVSPVDCEGHLDTAHYAWDLDGDNLFGLADSEPTGMTSTSTSFATPGSHTVRFQAPDTDGGLSTFTQDITAQNRPPTAAFSIQVLGPKTVRLDSSASTDIDSPTNPPTLTRAWDTDNDGNFDNGSGVTTDVTFSDTNKHTVRLQVSDQTASAVVTEDIIPGNTPPVAGFSASKPNPIANEPVTFTSAATDPDGSIVSTAWGLGTGSTFTDGSGTTFQHSFPAPGTYTVRQKVTDNAGGTDVATATVTVGNHLPTVSLSATPTSPLTSQSVKFTATAADSDGPAPTLAWDLDGDGQFNDAISAGPTATVSRSWSTPGTRTVRVQATDNHQAIAVAVKAVTVGDRPPVPSFTIVPGSPTVNQRATIVSTSTDPDDPIKAVAWDLNGDGQYNDATGVITTRSYGLAGTASVGMRVTDSSGRSSTLRRTIKVLAPVAGTITPFPVVRLAGRATRGGAHISKLTVNAPAGSRVEVRCSGRGCPVRKLTAHGAGRGKLLHFHRLERPLRAGIKIEIRVTKTGEIGKYTRFRIRRRHAPVRTDRCLPPGHRSPKTCATA